MVKKKKTLRSSQDSNLGPLNSGQMIGAEDRWHLSIDTVQFSGWISLRLGELCRISTEVVCAATSELGNSSSYFVCAVRTLIYRGWPEIFPISLASFWHAPCTDEVSLLRNNRGQSLLYKCLLLNTKPFLVCGMSLPCNLISLWLGLQEAPLNQTTNSPDNKTAKLTEVKILTKLDKYYVTELPISTTANVEMEC